MINQENDKPIELNSEILLHQLVSEISGKEREIINDFCKAFIAQKSLEGFEIGKLFDEYEFCVTHDFSNPCSSRYWFEKRNK